MHMMAGKAAGARGKKTRTVRRPARPAPPIAAETGRASKGDSGGDDLELLEVEMTKPKPSANLGIGCEAYAGGTGVQVTDLAPSALAAKCGVLYVGDVLVSINGETISDVNDALAKLKAASSRVAVEVLCTTAAQLALTPPHVMDTILSMRLLASEKQYLVRWSPSERRTWATLDQIMGQGAEASEMWEHFEVSATLAAASPLTVTLTLTLTLTTALTGDVREDRGGAQARPARLWCRAGQQLRRGRLSRLERLGQAAAARCHRRPRWRASQRAVPR